MENIELWKTIFLGVIAFGVLMVTVVVVLVLIYFRYLLKGIRTLVDSVNAMIVTARGNLEKAGSVISGVEQAVLELKNLITNFKNPFSALITFLASLFSLLIGRLKNTSLNKQTKKPRKKSSR
jgi:uncharacterized protein YpmS